MSANSYAEYLARRKLVDFLCKLQIKSAFPVSLSFALSTGYGLHVESLDAVLNVVSFEDKLLKYWPSIKK